MVFTVIAAAWAVMAVGCAVTAIMKRQCGNTHGNQVFLTFAFGGLVCAAIMMTGLGSTQLVTEVNGQTTLNLILLVAAVGFTIILAMLTSALFLAVQAFGVRRPPRP